MAMPPKTQFLRQKMARHFVSSSVEEEGICEVLQTKRIPIIPIQHQSHAFITFMSSASRQNILIKYFNGRPSQMKKVRIYTMRKKGAVLLCAAHRLDFPVI